MTTPNDMFAALDINHDLVYECIRCKKRFDGNENVTRTCRYHPGRREVDNRSSAFGAIKDFWFKHNPMHHLGPPGLLITVPFGIWRLGASYSCCDMRADLPGCKAREHDLWAKTHITLEPTLQEADNGQREQNGALDPQTIIGDCKVCHMNLTARSLQTKCFHHPANVELNLGPEAKTGDYYGFESQNMELLMTDPKWRPCFFYKCCGLRLGEGGCAIGAHVLEGALWSDTAATQGDMFGAGFPLPDR